MHGTTPWSARQVLPPHRLSSACTTWEIARLMGSRMLAMTFNQGSAASSLAGNSPPACARPGEH